MYNHNKGARRGNPKVLLEELGKDVAKGWLVLNYLELANMCNSRNCTSVAVRMDNMLTTEDRGYELD